MGDKFNLKDTRRIMDFASTVRCKTDEQVIEMIKSGEIQQYGLDDSVVDMILASRMHCKPEDIRVYRTEKNIALA